ncbi:oxygen-independent coproporphyrinogen III oxidase [mine drainage metagenome]|uniref:Oxygen-independent coproporphyrinogen III oxidase n=2 Tax=mine drainage metagenome TaxID=410659 RepID=T0XVN3_9ZZZZ
MSPVIDPELIRRYDAPGPRYTSYPTARHFQKGVTEAVFCESVAFSNEDPIPSDLSLYLHLPFCRRPCFYCGCTRIITHHAPRVSSYLDQLHQEIALQGAEISRDRVVRQLHLGGGTPTYLTDTELESLMGAIRKSFTLDEGPDREFGIEVDPRTVDANRLAHFLALGFNRVSFGIQDLDRTVQLAINRVQDPDHTLMLVEQAQAFGFASVNVDLLYGLPGQSLEHFQTTIQSVLKVHPGRIALYGYAHLPEQFSFQRQIPSTALPDAHARIALFLMAFERFTSSGYHPIGMDHFARDGDMLLNAARDGSLQRNFQGYSTHAGLDSVALGLSAISRIGTLYAQNTKDEADYLACLRAGHLPIRMGYRLNADDVIRADVIERIMCHEEVDGDAVEKRHRIRFRDYFASTLGHLKDLEHDGLVELTGNRLILKPTGQILRRIIAARFDAYRPQEDRSGHYSRMI